MWSSPSGTFRPRRDAWHGSSAGVRAGRASTPARAVRTRSSGWRTRTSSCSRRWVRVPLGTPSSGALDGWRGDLRARLRDLGRGSFRDALAERGSSPARDEGHGAGRRVGGVPGVAHRLLPPERTRGLLLFAIEHRSPPELLPARRRRSGREAAPHALDHVVVRSADVAASRALYATASACGSRSTAASRPSASARSSSGWRRQRSRSRGRSSRPPDPGATTRTGGSPGRSPTCGGARSASRQTASTSRRCAQGASRGPRLQRAQRHVRRPDAPHRTRRRS